LSGGTSGPGDGGPATSAALYTPLGVGADLAGTRWSPTQEATESGWSAA